MAKAAKLQTNFSKGELSRRLEGRPDLSAFFNGARRFENFISLPQGGALYRPGTRFVAEANSSNVRLIDFRFNLTDNFILELSEARMRFYKDGARIENPPGTPVQITTIWNINALPQIHYRQSNDVVYFFHGDFPTQKLSRISDISWTIADVKFAPPATAEFDTDIATPGLDATLTPGATTGTGINFTASQPKFLAGDVQRQIIFGASRAVITSFTSTTVVVADILDPFPDTDPIPATQWFLRFQPGTTVDSNVKTKGASGVADLALAGWRVGDVGKFIKVQGGLLEIKLFQTTTRVNVDVLVTLSDSVTENPPATEAWTLEETSWAFARGFPQSGEFHEGRLIVGPTNAQPTTFWGSVTDDFENFGVGSLADDAIEHRIASRRLNNILWFHSLKDLYIGTAEDELRVKGPGIDMPLGGDTTPNVRPVSAIGSMQMQPGAQTSGLILVQAATKRIYDFRFNIDADDFFPTDLTLASEQITGSGIFLDKIAIAKQPNDISFFVREDGQLAVLTYNPGQDVTAWGHWYLGGEAGASETTTDAQIQSVAIIPHPDADRDQVWVSVRRTINGVVKTFIEVFEDDNDDLRIIREWTSFQTDCAFLKTGMGGGTTATGFDHLALSTVDVVADGRYIGKLPVDVDGDIKLPESANQVEAGFRYDGVIQTMRPSIQGEMTEGLQRKWNHVFLRLVGTIGGTVKPSSSAAERIVFPTGDLPTFGWGVLDQPTARFSGDKRVEGSGWDTEGYITITQDQPYPMLITALFGEVEFGEWGDPSQISVDPQGDI